MIATPGVVMLSYFAVLGTLNAFSPVTIFTPAFTATLVSELSASVIIPGALILLLPAMAYGLWKMKKWAVILTISLFSIVLLIAILLLVASGYGIPGPMIIIAICASIIIYLSRMNAAGD